MVKADICIDLDKPCSECGTKGATRNGLCLKCITKRITEGGTMPDKTELKNIRAVEVKSKVVQVKDSAPKIVTAVKFEYDGEPSEVEDILMLEEQGQPIYADLYTPQGAFALDET